jgi:hypothetical protein
LFRKFFTRLFLFKYFFVKNAIPGISLQKRKCNEHWHLCKFLWYLLKRKKLPMYDLDSDPNNNSDPNLPTIPDSYPSLETF